jgi:pilus assembly protein TadC
MESLFKAVSIEVFGVWSIVLIIFIVILRYQTKRIEEKDKAIQDFLSKFMESEKQNVAIFTTLNEVMKTVTEGIKSSTKDTSDEFREITNLLRELHYNFQNIQDELKELNSKLL